ncbi:cytochrome P460 family protein [Methylobacterium nonmethylotrophicum]|uniref:Cytochrome P460 n=1 Tax=Methylobacterium nonmethylotrophicum TaxID=1141884 RepID=A0A4Z0NI74_9HYPH|nr:cytochrome P460 family protein [Methylobacterium nonmethylotrophicum]TGD95284.1 cytochrome P460 [Methylobacterium nonmethylotrophicum]
MVRIGWRSVAAACALALSPAAAGSADEDGSPLFGVRIPAGYRDWPVISVAHEAGNANDIRAILGNAIALKAFREGTRPFPDGAIIARLAWHYVSSPENDAVFGRPQSFVAGAPTNVQFSVKDAKRYAETGGWGYGQFENGKPDRSATLMQTCAPCHAGAPKGNDLVFTHYAP